MRTKRPSDGTQIRFSCRFGRNLRFVLLFAWETLWPLIGFFPVISQTLAITTLVYRIALGQVQLRAANP